MIVLLIEAAYTWDSSQGPGCDALEYMLSLAWKAALGYVGLFIACITVIPKIIATLNSTGNYGLGSFVYNSLN